MAGPWFLPVPSYAISVTAALITGDKLRWRLWWLEEDEGSTPSDPNMRSALVSSYSLLGSDRQGFSQLGKARWRTDKQKHFVSEYVRLLMIMGIKSMLASVPWCMIPVKFQLFAGYSKRYEKIGQQTWTWLILINLSYELWWSDQSECQQKGSRKYTYCDEDHD